MAELNLTNDYYKSKNPSLLWEMTICQSLGDGLGSFAKALNKPSSYGEMVADFLQKKTSLPQQCSQIVEIGGGYGTLMAGLLKKITPAQITMVDISPTLLNKQRERLSPLAISYLCQDVFSWLPTVRKPIDLLLLNEIIGDFPTIINLSKANLNAEKANPEFAPQIPTIPSITHLTNFELVKEACRIISKFNLNINDLPATFNLNYGALRFIELLAESPISRIFITEHGSDTQLPYPFTLFPTLSHSLNCGPNPRRIKLKDHDEYNICFDHLATIASAIGFEIERFHLMDLLNVRFDDEINFLLSTGKAQNEQQEILLEFYEHVAEYQGIMLQRKI